MKKFTGLEPILFYAFLALLLVPVWSVDFFVTGDGPCHFHNSKILLDWWTNHNKAFYDPFYYLNPLFNPNWLYNLITVPLLGMFKPMLAEKIFFSFYVAGFGFGFRFLISEINPKAKFLSTVGLLFCYNKLLITGFFNNSLSFVMWFWVVGWWWKKRNDFSYGTIIVSSLLLLALYLSHPIGLTFGLMMIGSMVMGLFFYERKESGKEKSRALFLQRIRTLFISALPSLVLFAQYMMGSNMTEDTTIRTIRDSWDYIYHLYSLVIVQTSEEPFALATSIVCGSIFLLAILLRIRQRKWFNADGLALFVFVVMFCILFPPKSISGGLDVAVRLAIIPFLVILFWSATADFPRWIQITTSVISLCIGIGFTTIRLPVHKNASDYASEIYSCKSYITYPATILVLNYDWEGHTPDGKLIAGRAGLFTHVDCYLGTEQSAIISDNYEAHFPYFPVVARWNTNMYGQTDKDGINFDNRPPRADILSYHRRTSQNLDYVLMIGYDEQFRTHAYTQEIFTQLEQGYSKVYTSEFERAVLYKRNDL